MRRALASTQSMSLAEARRVALRAQGFSAKPQAAPTPSKMLDTIRRIGLLQLDSVNVLVRSHYLPLFSRLGTYDRQALDRLSNHRPRKLFEYWGHEASLIPVERQPLFRWRMYEAREGRGIWGGPSRMASERPDFVRAVLQEIEDRGPLGAGELAQGGKSTGNWWGWSDGKRAVEYLFWTGQLTAGGRRGFERLYDLPQRAIPESVLSARTPSRADAQRELVEIAAKACGVATEADLRDYFRLPLADARSRVEELVEQKKLLPIHVEGWKNPAFLHATATLPRSSNASALLSPFDQLIWFRQRTERLFQFHYRLAFYTPKHKRTHGYYVMPFLLGDRLVARVDLKADRKTGKLLVLAGHCEAGITDDEVAPTLAAELAAMATWLGLESVKVSGTVSLLKALRRARISK